MRQPERQTLFLRRIRPYRWPVRLTVWTAVFISFFLPIWPLSFETIGLQICPEVSLFQSLLAIGGAWPDFPLSAIGCHLVTILFTLIIVGASSTMLGAATGAVFLFVKAKAAQDNLLPRDSRAIPPPEGQPLNYAPPRKVKNL